MKLDLTKPVQTRDGRKVQIIKTDIKSQYPVAAVITSGNGENLVNYTSDGRFDNVRAADPLDLVNVPEKYTYETWVVCYQDTASMLPDKKYFIHFDTPEQANKYAARLKEKPSRSVVVQFKMSQEYTVGAV